MGQSRPLFRLFHITIQLQIEKSIDGVLGIRTGGRKMVGADETMELWRPPNYVRLWSMITNYQKLFSKRLNAFS